MTDESSIAGSGSPAKAPTIQEHAASINIASPQQSAPLLLSSGSVGTSSSAASHPGARSSRASIGTLSPADRSGSPQISFDNLTQASAAAPLQDPLTADRKRASIISPSLLANPLFAKKSSIASFNQYGPLSSLIKYAEEHEPGALEVLSAECDALATCLRKVPNFASISSEQMQRTVQNAVRKTCDPGALLLQEGDLSGSILYIHSGSVSVSSASKGFIAHIYQDNIVGHHSYIYNRPRTATVHASTEHNSGLIYYEFMIADTDQASPDTRTRRFSVSTAAPSDAFAHHAASAASPDLLSRTLPPVAAAKADFLASIATTATAAPASTSTNSKTSKRGSLPSMPSIPATDEGKHQSLPLIFQFSDVCSPIPGFFLSAPVQHLNPASLNSKTAAAALQRLRGMLMLHTQTLLGV
jgi:hypothetical protein